MKLLNRLPVVFICLALSTPLADAQTVPTGNISVSGTVYVRPELRSACPSAYIVANLRDAGTNAIIARELIAPADSAGPDTSAGGPSMQLKALPCYEDPEGCAYTITMKAPVLKRQKFIISVELQDSLYLMSGGREGCNRVLGYYTGTALSAAPGEATADYTKAGAITIDAAHPSYEVKLDIR